MTVPGSKLAGSLPLVATSALVVALAACQPDPSAGLQPVGVNVAASHAPGPIAPSRTPFATLAPRSPRPERPDGATPPPAPGPSLLGTAGNGTPDPLDADAVEAAATPPPPLTTLLASSSAAKGQQLGAAEAASLERSLTTEAIAAVLPTDLIHDGGVVLYRLLDTQTGATTKPLETATPLPTATADAEPSPLEASPATKPDLNGSPTPGAKPSEKPGPLPSARPEASPTPVRKSPTPRPPVVEEPPTWARQDVAIGKAQTVASKGAAQGTVEAEVGYLNKGTFVFKPKAGGDAVKKPFEEVFRRRVRLANDGAGWKVQALGPLRFATHSAGVGLQVAKLALTSPADDSFGYQVASEADLDAVGKAPRVSAGLPLVLEASVVEPGRRQVFVYARQAGAQGGQERLQLLDDGVAPDQVKGDGRYTWGLKAPSKPGLYHLAVDVVDARSFLPDGPYKSVALGLTVEVLP